MSIYSGSVDDNDPSIIYSGSGWVLVTQDGDWTGTMHSTSVPGSWARFRFTGSRVVVICTLPTGDGQLSSASFQIDDGPAIPVSHVTTPPVQWQTPFWNSGPLSFGSHLLTITNLDNDAYFRMDRIDFDPTDSNSPPTPPALNTPQPSSSTPTISSPLSISSSSTLPVSQQSSSTTGTGATSFTTSSSNTLSSGSSQTSSLPTTSSSTSRNDPLVITGSGGDDAEKANSSLAGIIAGALGGVLLLVLLGIGVYCLRRRRQRIRRPQHSVPFDDPGITQVEAGSMTPNGLGNVSLLRPEYSTISHTRSSLTLLSVGNATSDSKSRNALVTWSSGPTTAETIYSPYTDTDTSRLSGSEPGSVQPALTVTGELSSKSSLLYIDHRLSVNHPSDGPPPAYHPTNS